MSMCMVQFHCCDCDDADCKRHFHPNEYPEGCTRCPNCLTLPTLSLLQRISNHLELIKANPERDPPDRAERDRERNSNHLELIKEIFVFGESVNERVNIWRFIHAALKDTEMVRRENIPTLPAPDWSTMRIYLRFLRLIGPA
eukprot:738070-Prorocentrum_minimum.AAC.1